MHETAGVVDGFILGGSMPQLSESFMIFLRRYWWICLGDTLIRPWLWGSAPRHLMGKLRSSWKNRQGNSETKSLPLMEALSMALTEEAKGKGAAKDLLLAFERAIAPDSDEYVTSVNKRNDRAVQFFEKMGFEVYRDDGSSMTFRKKL